MRTTVDLPDELLRALEVQAARRGETLEEVLTRAVSRELATNRSEGRRVELPLVGAGATPSVSVTSADIAPVLDDDDARHAR